MPEYWSSLYPRGRSQLRNETYEMVHSEGKSFASYVHSIKDAALVLRISEDEEQFVGRIVEGPTLTRFARLCSPFCNWRHLTVVNRNIAFADQTRTVQCTAVTVSIVEFHTTSFNSRHSHTQSSTTSNSGKPVVCFRCTKQRRIRERYFLSLAQLRKEEWQAAAAKPQLVPRARKIVGVVSGLTPRIEDNWGN